MPPRAIAGQTMKMSNSLIFTAVIAFLLLIYILYLMKKIISSPPSKGKSNRRTQNTRKQQVNAPAVQQSTSTASKKKKKKTKKKAEGNTTDQDDASAAKKETKISRAAKARAAKLSKAAPLPTVEDSDSDVEVDEAEAKRAAEQEAKKMRRKARKKAKKAAKAAEKLIAEQREDMDDGWSIVGGPSKEKKKKPKKSAAAVAAASGTVVISETVSIESRHIGVIIGPKGANLHAIQDGAEVEITMPPKGSTSAKVSVKVSGPRTGVTAAKRAIADLCNKGYCKFTTGADFQEGGVMVHPSYFPELIGAGGCVIRAINDTFGVRVNIPRTTDNSRPARVTLAGPKANVQNVKQVINQILRVYHHEATHPGMVHEEMEIPDYFYNILIGPRGSNIRHIQGNYKVKLHIPNEKTLNENVILVGSPRNVAAAKKHILKLMSSNDQVKVTDSQANDAEIHEDWMDQYARPSDW